MRTSFENSDLPIRKQAQDNHEVLGTHQTPPAHDCEDHLEERHATPERPYHYVGSGLPNVFLTGVRYFVCKVCGKQAADIPALKELLTEIARTIVDKPTVLNGFEVRFLRKRVSQKAVDFAKLVGFTPERLCTVETKGESVDLGRGKLIRVVYRVLAGEGKALVAVTKKFAQWLTSIEGKDANQRIVATWLRNRQWRVETEVCAA